MGKTLKYGSHDFPASAGFTHSCAGGLVKVKGHQRGGRIVGAPAFDAKESRGEAVKTLPKETTTMPHASVNMARGGHVRPPAPGRGSGEAASKGLTGNGPTGEAVKTQPKAKTTMPHASANVDLPPRATYGRLEANAPTGALAKAGGRSSLMPGYSRGRRVG